MKVKTGDTDGRTVEGGGERGWMEVKMGDTDLKGRGGGSGWK